MHCLEALNLMEIGELVFLAAIERKRPGVITSGADFPFTNPLLDKMLICKKVGW